MSSGAKPVNPRDIQLNAEEWREVNTATKPIGRKTIDAE